MRLFVLGGKTDAGSVTLGGPHLVEVRRGRRDAVEATVAGFLVVVTAAGVGTGADDVGPGFLDVSSALISPACSRQIR